MSENIVTSTSVNDVNKTTAKKAPAKKAAAKPKEEKLIENKEILNNTNNVIIIFESGASYSANGLRFTRQDNIQEVTQEEAAFLLTLENFRIPDVLELEDYLNSKED